MNKIVLIGDVMLDISIAGTVTRIAPEAPIGIITEVTRKETLGGAGNVYANLVAAEEDPYFITIVGDDDDAVKVENKITNGKVYKDYARKTTTKTRTYAYTNHIRKETLVTRLDKETTVDFIDFDKLFVDDVYECVSNAEFILFSDYKKGFVTKELVEYVKSLNHHARYIGDTKNLNDAYKDFYIITPNEFEISKWTDDKKQSLEEVLLMCKNTFGIEHPIITRGDKGIIFIDENQLIKMLPTTKHVAIDVLGAGDTFVAYLTSELNREKSLTEAAIVATEAAGISVTHDGAYAVKREELE